MRFLFPAFDIELDPICVVSKPLTSGEVFSGSLLALANRCNGGGGRLGSGSIFCSCCFWLFCSCPCCFLCFFRGLLLRPSDARKTTSFDTSDSLLSLANRCNGGG